MDVCQNILFPYKYQFFNCCPFCYKTDFINKGRNGTRNKVHPQVVKCINCGLLFVNPIMDEDSIAKYYYDYGKLNPRDDIISENVFSNVEKICGIIKSQGTPRYLDIGAASGEFVQAFQIKGWEAHGIEISETYVQFAKEKRGLTTIKCCSIANADFPENYFDYITFWHVIEHLTDPINVLRKIFFWLKPGGLLHMGMPNPTTSIGNLLSFFSGCYSLGQDHTFGFPKNTLKEIMVTLGYEIIHHKTYANQRSKNSYKNKIHNVIHKIAPMLVAYWQVIDVKKPMINDVS